MNTDPAATSFDQFRQEVYHQVLGHRQDSRFELMEATLAADGPMTLVRHSLSPLFHRRWPSTADALADGTLEPAQARRVLATELTPALWQQAQAGTGGRVVLALDGTVWPRPAAVTSPERTWGHRSTPGIPQDGVVPGWEYQWLVLVVQPGQSWVLPLDLARRGPGEPAPTALALRQLRQVQAVWPQPAPRPVVTFDSNYDVVRLAQAVQTPDPDQRLAAAVLVRLSKRRRLYRAPGPYAGQGAPRKHGPVIQLRDPATQGEPDRSAVGQDGRHGQVQVDVWEQVHDQRAAQTPLTLVRVQVERLPQAGRKPEPLWLAWVGEQLPDDLLDLWRWYALRFTVEHGFRFLKHELGWTRVRLRHPAAADRWSWLLLLALWELWLARPLVADQRLPWERPLAPERLTPSRVRRALRDFWRGWRAQSVPSGGEESPQDGAPGRVWARGSAMAWSIGGRNRRHRGANRPLEGNRHVYYRCVTAAERSAARKTLSKLKSVRIGRW